MHPRISVATTYGFSPRDLHQILGIATARRAEIETKWVDYFS